MIDSKEMQNARNLQKITTLIPEGKKIAIAPGKSNDHTKIWKVLDNVHGKSETKNPRSYNLHRHQ